MRWTAPFEALLPHGDVRARTNEGYTPLHLAAMRGNEEIVKALLAAGVAVDGTVPEIGSDTDTPTPPTPLELACQIGGEDGFKVPKILLAAGAGRMFERDRV